MFANLDLREKGSAGLNGSLQCTWVEIRITLFSKLKRYVPGFQMPWSSPCSRVFVDPQHVTCTGTESFGELMGTGRGKTGGKRTQEGQNGERVEAGKEGK